MKILKMETHKGSREYNADIIGHDNNMYYVCDGSTAVFDDHKFYEHGDLLEYMRLLNKNIKDSDSLSNSFKEAIRLSNKEFASDLELSKYQEWELPTYTIASIRETNETIEYYILCDTLISILYKDGTVENIEDRRLDPVKEISRGNRRKIKEDNTIDEETRKKLILENEQNTRMKANQDGTGFIVGSTKVESIVPGYKGIINKDLIDKILLCSDGFYDSEESMPHTKEDFELENVTKRVEEKLNHDVRDDLSVILLQNE